MFTTRRLANQIGPLLAALIFVAIGVGVLQGTDRFATDARWVSHTQEVMARIDEIQARLRDAESAQRGYLLTGQVDYLASYQAGKTQLPELLLGAAPWQAATGARAGRGGALPPSRKRQRCHRVHSAQRAGSPAGVFVCIGGR